MTRNRKRWFGRLFLLLGLVGFGSAGMVGAVLGGQSLYGWMVTAGDFSVSDIVVSGNEAVPAEEIIALSGIARGDNIFRSDPVEARERLSRDQRFEQVFVKRRLPKGIHIYLKERKPVAFIQLDRLYGVDADGALMPLPPVDRLPSLPILTGIVPESGGLLQSFREGYTSFETLSDSILYNAKVERALYVVDMIRAFDPAFMDRVSEIHVQHVHDPIVYTADNGTAIRLGIGHYPDKIRRLEGIMERLKRDKIETRWIDLRFDNQVIVRPLFTADPSDSTKS
jgi:cell division septal protein FtsQ